jgi:ArsR family transcriptional regulator
MATLGTTVELMNVLGDATRLRLLALCKERELTVAELTQITELPQSRVSTHLGRLREAGLLRDRKHGASTFYGLNDHAMPAEARKVWTLVQGQVADAILEGDRVRAARVLAAKAAAFPDGLAGQMERHYSPGRTWEATARAFVGLMRLGDVLDAGGGDGTIAELIAPRARSITLVDRSPRMVAAAHARVPGARCLVGDVHGLPLPDARFDEVLLLNVLTHSEAPARALAECARVLRPGGSLLVVTLEAHDHEDTAAAFRHVNRGFSAPSLRRLIAKAGLDVRHCEVTSREKRPPYFRVLTAFSEKKP